VFTLRAKQLAKKNRGASYARPGGSRKTLRYRRETSIIRRPGQDQGL